MFEQSLVECSSVLQPRRRWSIAAAGSLQLTLLATILLVQLLRIEKLPPLPIPQNLPIALISPAPEMHAASTPSGGSAIFAVASQPQFVQPGVIPRNIANDSGPGPVPHITDLCVSNCGNPSISGFGPAIGSMPMAHQAAQTVMHVSRLQPGEVLHQVQPVYPEAARTARIEGTVTLQAIIGVGGEIENLQVVEGNPFLVRSAMDAVRQWRFRPYLLNGNAVPVETEFVLTFHLQTQ